MNPVDAIFAAALILVVLRDLRRERRERRDREIGRRITGRKK